MQIYINLSLVLIFPSMELLMLIEALDVMDRRRWLLTTRWSMAAGMDTDQVREWSHPRKGVILKFLVLDLL